MTASADRARRLPLREPARPQPLAAPGGTRGAGRPASGLTASGLTASGLTASGLTASGLRGARTARERRLPPRLVWAAALALLAACLISAVTADSDTGSDLGTLGASVVRDAIHLRWQFAAVVVGCGALHYLATAVAARAAATVPLPWWELTLVQFTAAAANRITPAGLGGSTVTARYFIRRGMTGASAVGAIGALSLLGALADLLVGVAVVGLGSVVGLGGGTAEFARLGAYALRVLGPMRSPWLWLAVIGAVAGLLLVLRRRQRRHSGHARSIRSSLAESLAPARALCRHPVRMAQLLGASGGTTLVLGFAFVASVWMVPGPTPTVSVGALLIGFMLGAATGSAVPIPAGLGSTEAALVAVLSAAHVPLAHAVEQVLIFRLITFWAPAVVGLFASRPLYRRGML